MPTSKRDYIKRKHNAIDNALARSQGWLQELHDQFLAHHPDYAEGYECIAVMVEQARQAVLKMKSFI